MTDARALMAWPVFILCAGIIAYAGPLLVRYADVIGWRSNLSRSWIGIALLATATSLPELFTGISAVSFADAPDIAVGDVFGSCMFNLLLIVLLDGMYREKPLFVSITQGHLLTAGFGVIAIGIAGAAILTGRNGGTLAWHSIGMTTPVIIGLYVVSIRAVYRYEAAQPVNRELFEHYAAIPYRRAVIGYTIAASVIVVAAAALPFAAVEISALMGWRQAFVGALFVAAATSLPELFVTLGALRMRALDLAIANLLGSNLFNILILAIDDIAWRKGPLLPNVSSAHAVTAFMAAIMSGIVIVALVSRSGHRIRGVFGWASLSLLAVYLVGTLAVYLY